MTTARPDAPAVLRPRLTRSPSREHPDDWVVVGAVCPLCGLGIGLSITPEALASRWGQRGLRRLPCAECREPLDWSGAFGPIVNI